MLISEMLCRKKHRHLANMKAPRLAQQICAVNRWLRGCGRVHRLCARLVLLLFHRLYERGVSGSTDLWGSKAAVTDVSLSSENFTSDGVSVGGFSAQSRLSWVCCYAELLIYPQLRCGLQFRVLLVNHAPQMGSTLFIVKHGHM